MPKLPKELIEKALIKDTSVVGTPAKTKRGRPRKDDAAVNTVAQPVIERVVHVDEAGQKSSNRESVKVLTRSLYDLQNLRVGTGNRIAANFRAKLGIAPSSKTEDASEDAKGVLEIVTLAYKRMTDACVDGFIKPSKFVSDGVISSYTELCLIKQYVELLKREEEGFKLLGKTLEDFPIYTQFLTNVRGCGPAISGVIISELDPHKAEYPSSFWAYAGYDCCVTDGKGRSRRKEHLVEREYIDKNGEKQTKVGITFNPFLKTKLYLLGSCMMKAGGKYKLIYDGYKNRLENHDKHKDKSKGHRHAMALRYMVKQFLVDLYIEWRTLEGLPVAPTYSEAKLGKVHGKAS